jgi:hypothetical protein
MNSLAKCEVQHEIQHLYFLSANYSYQPKGDNAVSIGFFLLT